MSTFLLQRKKLQWKTWYSYQRPSKAHSVRTSISVKKYNLSYFLNIPDNPLIFLFIPTFIFVNTALEFIWSINYFQAQHAVMGGKGNKPDPKHKDKDFHISIKVIHAKKNKPTSNPHNHAKNLTLIFLTSANKMETIL